MSENILNAGELLLLSKYGTSDLQHTGLGDTQFWDDGGGICPSAPFWGKPLAADRYDGMPPWFCQGIHDSMVNKLPFQMKEQICALLVTKEPHAD